MKSKILFVYDSKVNLNIIRVLSATPKYYSSNGFNVSYLFEGQIEDSLKKYIPNAKFYNFHKLIDFKTKNRLLTFFLTRFNNVVNNFVMKSKLKKLVKSNNYDYVYLIGPNSINSFASLSNKLKSGITVIHRYLGTWDLYKSYMNKNYLRLLLYIPTIRAIKSKCDLAVLTNDGTQTKSIYEQISTNPILSIRDGVNIDDKLINKSSVNKKNIGKKYGVDLSNKKILLAVSRLVHIKRVDRIIDVCKEYKKLDTNFILFIVGDGNQMITLREKVKSLNLSDNVIFTGRIKNEDVHNYYNIADIFLSMYDVSNVGNPLLESLYHENIIFTLDVGETNKIINHKKNGFIYKPVGNYFKKMAKDINFILTKDDSYKEMKKNIKLIKKEVVFLWPERLKQELKEIKKLNISKGNKNE